MWRSIAYLRAKRRPDLVLHSGRGCSAPLQAAYLPRSRRRLPRCNKPSPIMPRRSRTICSKHWPSAEVCVSRGRFAKANAIIKPRQRHRLLTIPRVRTIANSVGAWGRRIRRLRMWRRTRGSLHSTHRHQVKVLAMVKRGGFCGSLEVCARHPKRPAGASREYDISSQPGVANSVDRGSE